MLCIQGKHHGRAAIIPAAIIDAARYKQHKDAESPMLDGVRPYRALIDTGATSTMITNRVKSDLGLQAVSMREFHSLDGLAFRPVCLFHVAFYKMLTVDEMERERPSADEILVRGEPVLGGIINTNGASFDVLIGMDIISTWDFRTSRDGTFKITFPL